MHSNDEMVYLRDVVETLIYMTDEDSDGVEEVMQLPSIDIVRCSECKYASDDGTYGCMCEHFNDTSDAYHRMWSDDFCSYGERSSE